MTSVDPSRETTSAARRAIKLQAALVAAELFTDPRVVSAAILHGDSDTDPSVAARATDLPAAREAAAAYDLTWHTQAAGDPAAGTWVHAFDGVYSGFPVVLYALGPADANAAVIDGMCALPLLLGGLTL